MGLLSDIQSALTEAFAGDLSDVVSSFSLVKNSEGVYDVDTGKKVSVETLYASKGVFTSFGAMEIDGVNIKSEDEKLIINGADITTAIDKDDIVRLSDLQEYTVKNATPVMGGGTTPIVWIVQVTKNAKKND